MTEWQPIRIQKELYDEIGKAIQNGFYLNEHEFIRDAIRDKLVQLRREV